MVHGPLTVRNIDELIVGAPASVPRGTDDRSKRASRALFPRGQTAKGRPLGFLLN
jgi:hypothetical protein